MSTQQNEINVGTPLAERIGFQPRCMSERAIANLTHNVKHDAEAERR